MKKTARVIRSTITFSIILNLFSQIQYYKNFKKISSSKFSSKTKGFAVQIDYTKKNILNFSYINNLTLTFFDERY